MKLFRVKRIWHYRFQLDGKRVQRSTHETNQRRAEVVANKAWRAVCESTRPSGAKTLKELGKEWMTHHELIVSHAYLRSMDQLLRLHLYGLAPLRLDELTTPRVEAAMLMHRSTHAQSSTNGWLRLLKVLARWAVRRHLIAGVPWEIRTVRIQKKPRPILPLSVTTAWLDAVDVYSIRSRAAAVAVRLMFGLGLRESETITARWEWIDWERCTYTPGCTKGREAVALPMPAWLVSYLAPLRKTGGLIVTNRRGCACCPGFTRRAMRSANVRCDVQGLTAHRLRGTFGTLLSEAGIPVQTVQRLMRHKDPLTTIGYLEVNVDLAVQAQQTIARRTGLAPTTD
ncbi:tyrosine-type recombinase/integrase [Burkholderia sp. WAC0059]|uniref:tyrosine-type recombinase/integrase n=1 Tax=Burkholderia sp. WAC0059 TaxID=2066022 RepID=UPI0015E09B72|nr:site-specific integrase [Burkholderia sp. WAC0059]